MPYLFFWLSLCIGILSAKGGIVSSILAVVAICTFILSKVPSQGRGILELCMGGIIIGVVLHGKIGGNEIIVGEYCQGRVMKEYENAIMVRYSRCTLSFRRFGYLYAKNANGLFVHLYDKVTVEVLSAKNFGRFQGKANVTEVVESGRKEASMYYFWLRQGNRFRDSYFEWLKRGNLTPDQGGLVTSMLFGEVGLNREIKATMKDLGLLHIIAISGINITYLQMLLRFLTIKLNRYCRYIVEIVTLIVLFFIVGEAVSLIRAMVMALLGIFLRLGGVRKDRWNFLFALSIVLILDASHISDAGYWLVTSACFGVYIVVPLLQKGILRRKPVVLVEFLGNIAIWCCVIPAQMLIFRELRPLGVIVGFIISPLVEIITVIGYASVILRYLPFVEPIVVYILGVFSSLILYVTTLFHI